MGQPLDYVSLPSFTVTLSLFSEDVTLTDDLNTDLITDLSCNVTMEENTFQKQRKQFFYELFHYFLGVNACHSRMKHQWSEDPLRYTHYPFILPIYVLRRIPVIETDNIKERRQVRFL